ncbi:MAG: hypothetical protein HYS17_01890 [Micavibrio aeruginosavorus]|uniref:Thiol:disulfide interchange protein DsbD N-terminal domain-containing protein n=1 Tax=Micavibrio aeruginosavorus TaxID=349221 RepID=A0A7T5R2X1_9BACT|nr:MAG: hypothetical protein HYS17_01890 [Micavibrio aeruginosavorus]
MATKTEKFLNYIHFMSFLLMPCVAQAAESSWAKADFVKARLITAQSSVGSQASIRAVLDLEMEPEWHIYWRMPGDGGLPPDLDWTASQNLKEAVMGWPAPRRFEYEGLYGFGYKDAARLPITLTPEKSGEPVALSVQADIMVCKDLCVPQALTLSLTLPVGTGEEDAQASLVEQEFASLPPRENQPDIRIDNVVLGPKAIVVQAYLAQGFEGADLFAEAGTGVYMLAPPVITPDDKDPRQASLLIAAPEGVDNLAQAIMGKSLTLTLVKDDRAIERTFDF